MKFGFAVLSVALVAGQVAASVITSRSPLISALRSRQVAGFDPSEIPSECQSDCSAISSVLTSSTCSSDLSCVCSSSAANGLYTCLQCALSLNPDDSLLDQAQESYDEYSQACSSGGVSVASKTLTLPSGTTSGSSSAAAPASSATSGSQTTGSGSSTSSGTSTDSGAQRNGVRGGVAVSSVGLLGAVGAVALLAF
ncbi:hypothetical protein C2E23DRAFT_863146 [Lenzites betulinus]|nr:hypothetical protein C2E23DRAFT_863146 [Lenzites betulinus]